MEQRWETAKDKEEKNLGNPGASLPDRCFSSLSVPGHQKSLGK
jgi:hypothetical protein